MKTNNLKDIEKSNPFKVPEGYFDHFTKEMLPLLPEKERIETERLSFWSRVKPWAYMAAMFAGIALMIDLFVGEQIKENKSTAVLSTGDSVPVVEIDAFYSYYEEQYADATYRDEFLLENETEDNY